MVVGKLFVMVMFCFSIIVTYVNAGKAVCHNPIYPTCYGSKHKCPASCPTFCDIDCRSCKPYCTCDKPGAVCQDPRFIGGDGIMFYFHGKKDMDFCLASDVKLHINAHFIGKKNKKGRDFTWVQSMGILFGPHQIYIGAKKVAKWDDSKDNMLVQLNREEIMIPNDKGRTWESPKVGLSLKRLSETNKIQVKVDGIFDIVASVVPITIKESLIHGYDVREEDSFAHLEINFKFKSLSNMVDGVLGQTYRPSYQTGVKISAAMPIMGGAHKFASSLLFATDCAVSKFGRYWKNTEDVSGMQY